MASFFFFQAEDGIRDLYVTGVQTCALPISASPFGRQLTGVNLERLLALGRSLVEERPLTSAELRPLLRKRWPKRDEESLRSEERRVGKEGRSGGWQDHERRKMMVREDVGRA